jgi:DNA-binding transcriptional LysR family regulator
MTGNWGSSASSPAAFISDLLIGCPHVQIELAQVASPIAIRALYANDADVAILSADHPAPGCVTLPNREEDWVAVVPIDHPLAARRHRCARPDSLQGQSWAGADPKATFALERAMQRLLRSDTAKGV